MTNQRLQYYLGPAGVCDNPEEGHLSLQVHLGEGGRVGEARLYCGQPHLHKTGYYCTHVVYTVHMYTVHSLTSSLIEVWRMLSSLAAGSLEELLTRDRTDLRNSAVLDLTAGVVEDDDEEADDDVEGMRWGKVSRR